MKRRWYPCSGRPTDSTNYQKYVSIPPEVLRNPPQGYSVILPVYFVIPLGGTPYTYNGLYGKVLLKKGAFYRLQVNEKG